MQFLSLEQSNFVSGVRTIKKAAELSSLTFFVIQVTSKLAALDISRLLDMVMGTSIRLLILDYPSLLFTLQFTGKIGAVVVPDTLKKSDHMDVKPYSAFGCAATLGKAIDGSSETALARPESLKMDNEQIKNIRSIITKRQSCDRVINNLEKPSIHYLCVFG
jgi:hypothetical protein